MKGKVYLIGAGPGDAELITVKGANCIQKADVIIYDFLASKQLLKYAQSNAEKIYVGKQGSKHTLSQDQINVLLVERAKEGHIIARLKGGDPFIFGRGGEEAEILVDAGIEFEIIPGVTSGIAAPAYAGIPLTHRDYNSTLALVTGHEDPLKETSAIDWQSLAKGIGTLVFFMGVKNLPEISQQLIANGKPSNTPVAIIQWGTTSRQKTVIGNLSDIAKKAHEKGIKAPSIIVVSEVVNLRDKLNWFEKRPLFGKRIVVTRAREQASDLVKMLTDLGADCLEYPTIKVVKEQNLQALTVAIDNIGSYDWMIFTSINGVKFFFTHLFETGKDVRCLGHIKIAAIGPATAESLTDYGIKCDLIPDTYRAEAIIEAFEKRSETLNGKRILIPRAKEARAILPKSLSEMGAHVDEISIYTTIPVHDDIPELLDLLEKKSIDLITFTSSSTVQNFKALIPSDRFSDLIKDVTIATIGPITAETAQNLGFNTHIVAKEYTIEGLCDAIVSHYQ